MPINVQLQDGNFSLGPISGFFYSISRSLNALVQVEADGTVANVFPMTLSRLRNAVVELHFDGTFFWSLEALPSDLGIVIKKWRLFPHKTFAFPSVIPTELRWQDELTLINGPTIRWESNAFAVQHYHRTFDSSFDRGEAVIELDDVTQINAGDILHLGPSSFGGFVGNEESIVVGSVNSNNNLISFSKPGGLENSYISADPIDFHKSLYLFNNHSFSGNEDGQGSFVEFELPNKQIVRSDKGKKYGDVGAADFDQTILAWSRSSQILQLDVFSPTFDLQSSLEANMMESNLTDTIEMFDMVADLDSNLFLKLQQKETTEDIGTGILTTSAFPDNRFNFQTQTTLAVVNSTALSFPDTRITTPAPAGDSFPVIAEIRDQFNLPAFGESVQFTAALNALSDSGSPGTFTSPTVVTNTSGIAETTYVPSITPTDVLVDITAKVL